MFNPSFTHCIALKRYSLLIGSHSGGNVLAICSYGVERAQVKWKDTIGSIVRY